jgi:Flp pilus assembly protein CpaB
VSRRTRAFVFLGLALVTAAVAAGIADSYGSRVASGYGPLRQVVVATKSLEAESVLGPADVAGGLDVRRVPVRFAPAGALHDPREALGLEPTVGLEPGSYLVASQLRARQPRSGPAGVLAPHRRPVEIAVSGAEAMPATGAAGAGGKVDVVVTTEPSGSGPGRTYVAVAAVPLLALGPGADGPGPGGMAAATLALTRREALRLIAAESFARKLTLLPEGR